MVLERILFESFQCCRVFQQAYGEVNVFILRRLWHTVFSLSIITNVLSAHNRVICAGAGLSFAYQETTSEITIAKRIGMNRVFWPRKVWNTLFKEVIEVVDSSANIQYWLEARGHGI